MTKLYVSAVMLQLRHEGAIGLDDPMSKYLPSDLIAGLHVLDGTDRTGQITIRHLMSNTSGITDYFFGKGPDGKAAASALFAGQDEAWPLERIVERVRTLEPRFAPGRRGKVHYSDTNYELPLLLINITAGPTGEQLGWRAFALQEIQKRRSPLVASLWVGLLWGVWHLPLWLVSGYTGLELLLYSGSFLIAIVSFSVFLTFFYNKTGNILVAVWIHFLFNMLLQIVVLDTLRLMSVVSVFYLMAATLVVLLNRRAMADRPIEERIA